MTLDSQIRQIAEEFRRYSLPVVLAAALAFVLIMRRPRA